MTIEVVINTVLRKDVTFTIDGRVGRNVISSVADSETEHMYVVNAALRAT